MNDLKRETDFFHDIVPQVIKLVINSDNASITQDKGMGDYATDVDIAVEDLIVAEIQKRFPDDLILAEEGSSGVKIPKGRAWIIDPICGTTNLAKGLSNYCTNIALAQNSELVASCVIDYSQNNYFWSTGESKVYVNDKLYKPAQEDFGVKIDIDLGAIRNVDSVQQQKHLRGLSKILEKTNYDVISLNTSLGFAYTAVGKVDGFINVQNNPWDIAAASFLIQQSADGVISDIEGRPWTLSSVGAIGARNQTIHEELLSLYLGY